MDAHKFAISSIRPSHVITAAQSFKLDLEVPPINTMTNLYSWLLSPFSFYLISMKTTNSPHTTMASFNPPPKKIHDDMERWIMDRFDRLEAGPDSTGLIDLSDT